MDDPHVAGLRVFPVKALDGATVDTAELHAGALAPDRRYAVVDEDGEYVNGKRTDAVHRIDATFGGDLDTVTVAAPELDTASFHLDDDRDAFAAWLSEHFGYDVEVVVDRDLGHPDDTTLTGPTVVSTATLEAVADWFPDLSVESVRRRFRANVEVGGVPTFWEDRLYGEDGRGVAFTLGEVELLGANPCRRCVVPTRDPDTGERHPDFQRVFVERREATLPAWAERSRFDTYYRLMVNTLAAPGQDGRRIATGDPVSVGDECALPGTHR